MTDLQHTDGIPWWDAPAPRRWHRCRPQSFAWIDLTLVARCACGGVQINGGHWFERNQRSRRRG